MGLFGLFIIEFSLWNNFGNYIWYVSIGFTVLDMFIGDIVSYQLKEVRTIGGEVGFQLSLRCLPYFCHHFYAGVVASCSSRVFGVDQIVAPAGSPRSSCRDWPGHSYWNHWDGSQRLHGLLAVVFR